MVELTRVFTVEITGIQEGDINNILPKEQAAVGMREQLKSYLGADDVVVTKVQDFIRE